MPIDYVHASCTCTLLHVCVGWYVHASHISYWLCNMDVRCSMAYDYNSQVFTKIRACMMRAPFNRTAVEVGITEKSKPWADNTFSNKQRDLATWYRLQQQYLQGGENVTRDFVKRELLKGHPMLVAHWPGKSSLL